MTRPRVSWVAAAALLAVGCAADPEPAPADAPPEQRELEPEQERELELEEERELSSEEVRELEPEAASTTSAAAATLAEADQVFRSRRYDDAEQVYRKALAVADQEGNDDVAVEALAQIARCYSLRRDLGGGRPFLERAARRADPERPLGWSRLLGVQGIYARESGDKPGAVSTFKDMYSYCLERDLPRRNAAEIAA